ncbi:LytR/AlgR family response regulator transcription factor [Flavobacterium caseinilyticum]|uniref:Response regulator transcription factor n=1 Tax=Flavobacterium caseinilyticum TaxID=2541732 RepID=A0A4V2YTU4_9FLAO|nr:LytTR family DNA-binding domain-containing protein [Flavobacterium caseinilyticum]TDD74997.1 response regulator transcription factor [Flavobacterium caseinilyticum]
MKLKAIIVDDEFHARSFLKKLCNHLYNDKIEILDECDSVQKAVSSIKKHNPDIVFLDIQMPEENGFELFKYFDSIAFEIIFTTAHKEYAIDAIKNSALDYLIKPINIEDFKRAIDRIEKVKTDKINFDRYKLLAENLANQNTGKERIVFPSKIGFEVVQANTIIFCKSDGAYTTVYTLDKKYFTSKSFKETCELLHCSNFLRVHRSFLINVSFVISFKSDDFLLEMITGDKIPVSDKSFTKKELIDAISK